MTKKPRTPSPEGAPERRLAEAEPSPEKTGSLPPDQPQESLGPRRPAEDCG